MLINANTKRSRMLLCAAAFAVGAVGCAADEAPTAEDAMGNAEPLTLQVPPSTEQTTPSPNSTHFAEVTANGTGCPPGTWQTSLSDDGLTFTTTFSQYETAVDPSKVVDVKDCQLAIKLHSPGGLSYSVSEFSYSGYAYLEPGVSLAQTANYYFQGAPVNAESGRTNLDGFYDDAFLFKDTVGTADAVWSPCGAVRDLNVTTRLRLLNSRNPRRSGYGNITAVDGRTEAALVVRFRTRPCT
jgi:hypothetical protein